MIAPKARKDSMENSTGPAPASNACTSTCPGLPSAWTSREAVDTH